MSDDAAFLRAILAAPDDDLPRLVYADYLDDRDDPRGEFIRLQMAIAAIADEPRSERGIYDACRPTARDPRDDVRLADLRAEESSFLEAFGPEWLAPLGPAATGLRFWRGFIDTVRCRAEAFVADGGRWAESMAVRRLSLDGITEHADALAACPFLASVRAIEFAWGEGYEDVMLALARSPFAAGLRELYVHGFVSDVAARAVLHSPHLVGLTTFVAPAHGLFGAEVAYAMRRRFGGRW